jgi:hypothetical protein
MNQDLIQQELTAGGNGGSTTTGFATGTKVTSSGTYRCSNRYMDVVQVYSVGEVFLPGPDGKKTTWYALASNLNTKDGDGGFRSVKVEAGTI